MKFILVILLLGFVVNLLQVNGQLEFSTSTCKYGQKKRTLPKTTYIQSLKNILDNVQQIRDTVQITDKDIEHIDWEALTNNMHKGKREIEEISVSCAAPTVPLLWDDRSNPKNLTTYIQRYQRSKSSNKPKMQLWLLQGGPGGSGYALYAIAKFLISYFDATDKLNPVIYVPDHRGTGYSSYLMCDKFVEIDNVNYNIQVGRIGTKQQQQECWEDIVKQYPNGELKGFGTSNSARDILYYIEQENIALGLNTKAAVYGVSYGTYWLNRIMYLQPTTSAKIDFVIADSVVKTTMDFLERDLHYDEAVELFMAECGKDTDCFKRFNGKYKNVEEMVKTVFKNMKDETCVKGIDPAKLSLMSTRLLPQNDYRRLIFPAFFRYDRCTLDDRIFLELMKLRFIDPIVIPTELSKLTLGGSIETLTRQEAEDTIPSAQRLNNGNLFVLVATSEITDLTEPEPRQYWVDRYKSTPPYFNSYLSPILTDSYEIIKNDTYNEVHRHTYANDNFNMMIMHCSLDPQTPFSFGKDWFRHFTRATTIMYPNCVHGAIISTNLKKEYVESTMLPTLGMTDIIKFLSNETTSDDEEKKKMFDYKMQWSEFQDSKMKAILGIGLGCATLYDECVPNFKWILGVIIALFASCCLCCCVCCGALLILAIYKTAKRVKKGKKKKSGEVFYRFDQTSNDYTPPQPSDYTPNPQPY